MNNRIKEVRKKLGLTQTEFAERIGSVQNTVTGYESGRRKPSNIVISSICKEFNINETWLRTGDGEMFDNKKSSLSMELKDRFHLSDGAALLIEKFINLKESDREVVVNFLLGAAEDLAALDRPVLSPEEIYEKSLLNAPGTGSSASNTTEDTESVNEKINII